MPREATFTTLLTYRGVNAVAEALNGTYKTELVKLHGAWRTRARIDWYNQTRLHREIGDIPPIEHEANWYRQNQTSRQAVTN